MQRANLALFITVALILAMPVTAQADDRSPEVRSSALAESTSAESAAGAMDTPDPAWSLRGARSPAGAARIGSTKYAVPSGAVYVNARASAGGSGTAAAPYRYLQSAIDRSTSGAVLVLRGGVYHQSAVVPAGKRLTIQSYPGEAVWLDGSTKLSTWTAAGADWYSAKWTYDFDSTPGFTKGARDGTARDWQWINPAYPMAAHPELVWIDGVLQREVASRSLLTAGTFFTDTTADRLYLGSNPRGHKVRAATLTKALSLRGEGTIIRGIGVRGYATSVWMMGAVTAEAPKVTLENVQIHSTATTGLFVGAADVTLRKVTLARNGLMGLGANFADRLLVDRLLANGNNHEHFNQTPVSGGLKITTSRGFSVKSSAFLRNDGPGLWTDESVYDVDISASDFADNAGQGVALELSQRVDFVNNVVLRNAGNAIKINNTGGVNIWNNSLAGGNRVLNIVQDSRRSTGTSVPGHDPRRPVPDPTMPWLIRDISIGNNVITQSTGNCTICVEDYSFTYAASELNIDSDSNVIQRDAANKPTWIVVWSRGKANHDPYAFTSLPAYRDTTGQDLRSLGIEGRAVTDKTGRLLTDVRAPAAAVAVNPPAAVTGLLGTTAGSMGARFP